MKNGINIIWLLLFCLSCAKEPKPCTVSSYIGTWKVKNNIICDIDSTLEVVIEQGPWASQIQLKYGEDTLVYNVAECKATHNSQDLGWVRKSEMELKNDQIEFKHERWILILYQNCSMTLIKK
jgi:hypothetical protein